MNKTLEEFRGEVMTAAKNRPAGWRKGQAVFNYIDEWYSVAREVQFCDRLDCFYNDGNIDEFIKKSYERITNGK